MHMGIHYSDLHKLTKVSVMNTPMWIRFAERYFFIGLLGVIVAVNLGQMLA